MAAQTTTPAATDLKTLIAAAGAEREAAREMLNLARAEGDPAEIALAEGMVKDALKAYRQLVPADPKKAAPPVVAPVVTPAAPVATPPAREPVQLAKAPTAQEALADALGRIKTEEARKAPDDPTRLSGTEQRRKAARAESAQRAAVAERQETAEAAVADARVDAYLEPVMRELLADQVLRGEAVRWTRRLIEWLNEADSHCTNQQPVLARKYLGLIRAELGAQEQALRDAETPKGAK